MELEFCELEKMFAAYVDLKNTFDSVPGKKMHVIPGKSCDIMTEQ